MKNRLGYGFTLINLLVAVVIIGFLAALALPARAQTAPGLYTFFSGVTLPTASSNQYTNASPASTNTWGIQGTSTNFLVNVSSCDYAGVTITGTGSGTTSNLVTFYKSYDGGATFESTPTFSYAQSFTSGTVTTTNASLDVHGCTHLALVMGPVGSRNITNASISINLKSPWMYATAPVSFGKMTGKPISVPTWYTNSN